MKLGCCTQYGKLNMIDYQLLGKGRLEKPRISKLTFRSLLLQRPRYQAFPLRFPLAWR